MLDARHSRPLLQGVKVDNPLSLLASHRAVMYHSQNGGGMVPAVFLVLPIGPVQFPERPGSGINSESSGEAVTGFDNIPFNAPARSFIAVSIAIWFLFGQKKTIAS